MRGSDKRSGSLFSYVDLEARVRRDHPLRAIRHFADGALEALTVGFGELYSSTGRPSIPPEMLLRAMLLQAFYTIRSERQLMERMEFDLLFRWFVGLSIDDPIWDHSVFSKNRDRLLEGDAAAAFGPATDRLEGRTFDARIGSRPLPPSLAVYTNLSDDPNVTPGRRSAYPLGRCLTQQQGHSRDHLDGALRDGPWV